MMLTRPGDLPEGTTVSEERFGIYVHIPFCRHRCLYCDYLSIAGREGEITSYLSALGKEIALRAPSTPQPATSLYIGGGTPSLLGPAGIEFLVSTCRASLDIAPDAEISLEVNPESSSPQLFEAALAAGVNRLVIGVVSLNDYVLELLGRLHSAQVARGCYLTARGLGFEDVCVEMLYGLPAQTEEDFEAGIREVIGWEPQHVGLYALTTAPRTPVHSLYLDDLLPLPSESSTTDMCARAREMLGEAGLVQYEICNFAGPGRESAHNLAYWNLDPYLGLGLGAHSYLGEKRMRNVSSFERYIEILTGEGGLGDLVSVAEEIPPHRAIREALLQGLRQNRGIPIDDFEIRYGTSVFALNDKAVRSLTQAGLLEIEDGNLRLSPRGLVLSSQVFRQFL